MPCGCQFRVVKQTCVYNCLHIFIIEYQILAQRFIIPTFVEVPAVNSEIQRVRYFAWIDLCLCVVTRPRSSRTFKWWQTSTLAWPLLNVVVRTLAANSCNGSVLLHLCPTSYISFPTTHPHTTQSKSPLSISLRWSSWSCGGTGMWWGPCHQCRFLDSRRRIMKAAKPNRLYHIYIASLGRVHPKLHSRETPNLSERSEHRFTTC